MAQAFIGLGSNLGDRKAALNAAITALSQTPCIDVRRVSAFLDTPPAGGPPQPDFLNAAVELETSFPPRTLLKQLLAIEARMGRVRSEKWCPRTIDLDLLLYEQEVLDEPDLQLPHPLMHTRAFVLEPLAQIAPNAHHPLLDKTAAQLLADLHTDAA